MVIVFVLVGLAVLSAFCGLQWYAWRRVVRDTTARGSAARRIGSVVFVAGPLLMFGAFGSTRAEAPFWLQQVLAWPGYLWMAFSLYLVLALLVGEFIRPLLRRWPARRDSAAGAPGGHGSGALPQRLEHPVGAGDRTAAGGVRGPEPEPELGAEPEDAPVQATGPELGGELAQEPVVGEPAQEPVPAAATVTAPAGGGPSRRLFVSRIVGGAAAAVALGTVGNGAYGVLSGPKVKRLTVPLAKLPRAAHGFRIAVVSDIHLGPILGRGFTQRVVDTINATQPDLVAVVGDLVDGSVENLGPAVEPLAQLRARHGAYFVTGNHEYFSGAEQWVDHVRELGLNPLENARVEIDGFDLAGVNDISGDDYGDGPDYVKALGDRDTARAAVLLAHQPVMIHEAVKHGVDLQLSGHTHGGQLWPGNFIAGAANPTLAGLEQYGDTQLYVSRGAGAWGPPVRVGAPSDITVVELASKQA
ncbi:metallophosphoesterase [Streptomyces sp. PSKA54]|uniref:Metallophosphoesterase n=1 Tax=Streptomyces himalayensis subsp. aureolus TaxID=2758039 RepID=A0A7W2CYQ7_9ACTN|nr:metallophosphoesterase [Streptomyces himalayensis]MBA4861531.1 metallophosphoesterase [Streptomyces himalayensis subsp. aureolus]